MATPSSDQPSLTVLADIPGPQPVGLVGPVSNGAPAPQFVPAGYAELGDLDGFARTHARRLTGRVREVARLTGFCLLVTRAALSVAGALDEGYGLGFFEDDDLGERVKRAGFKLLLAEDVYVHHEGSRTFQALGLNAEKLLAENLGRFRAKWGEAAAAPYRLPAAAKSRPTVSLTMIVKNEEANLPACLDSAAGLFDELVVVDTGSADRTREIAARLGARAGNFPWVDSFAAARNAALDLATGDYAFWLDADDRIDAANYARLRELLAGLHDEPAAYVLKCRCVPDRPGGTATVVDHVRLFRRDPAIRWEFRVHEQVLPSLRAAGHDVRFSDIAVDHVGYTDPALRRRKLDRDLRLLHLEDADRPGHPFTLFNLGCVRHEIGEYAGSLDALRQSLAGSQPTDSIVRKLYALIAQCERALGRRDAALTACSDGRRHYPDDAELLFVEALARRESGDLAGAEACLRRLVDGGEKAHFASVDADLRGVKGRHNLAVLLREQGREAEAAEQWRLALMQRPDFQPALQALSDREPPPANVRGR